MYVLRGNYYKSVLLNVPFSQLLSQSFDWWAGQTGSATLKMQKKKKKPSFTSNWTISTNKFGLHIHVWACITQTVAHDRNRSGKLRVPLFEKSV